MTESPEIQTLPRRERELFELLYAAGSATAAELHQRMSDPPSYSAARALLARLEGRGVIRRKAEKAPIVYECAEQVGDVRSNAMRRMVETFFHGSAGAAATALLGMSEDLSADDLNELQRMIDQQKRAGR